VCCTCWAPGWARNDLYSELRDLEEWDGESQVWTYFAQPAVFEMPEPHPSTRG
jgi:hypothetical protein